MFDELPYTFQVERHWNLLDEANFPIWNGQDANGADDEEVEGCASHDGTSGKVTFTSGLHAKQTEPKKTPTPI